MYVRMYVSHFDLMYVASSKYVIGACDDACVHIRKYECLFSVVTKWTPVHMRFNTLLIYHNGQIDLIAGLCVCVRVCIE